MGSSFCLLLGPIYTKSQRQRCENSVMMLENNGVTPEWGCNLFSSDSTVFNENRIANIIVRVVAALMPTLGVNGPLQPANGVAGR